MSKLPRISETEWEIMRVVWAHQPVTAADIIVELARQDPTWHPMTAKTLLNRLVKKGALKFKADGRAYLYEAAVQERDCVAAATDSFVGRVFGGSLSTLVAHFVGEHKLTPRQIREIRRVLGSDKDP